MKKAIDAITAQIEACTARRHALRAERRDLKLEDFDGCSQRFNREYNDLTREIERMMGENEGLVTARMLVRDLLPEADFMDRWSDELDKSLDALNAITR